MSPRNHATAIKPSASICRNLTSGGLSLNHPICPESSHGVRGFEVKESWGTAEGNVSSATVSAPRLSPHQYFLSHASSCQACSLLKEAENPPILGKLEGVRKTAICAVSQDWSHSSDHTGMSVCSPKTHAFTASSSELLGRLIRLCQNPEFLLKWSLYVLS